MKASISSGLKIVVGVYAVLFAIYGLMHVISPELMQAKDPAIERLLGAGIVVFAVGVWLAIRQSGWDRARIMILIQVAWMLAYAVFMAWGILSGEITAAAWPPTIIGAAFAVVLAIFYFREEGIGQSAAKP